MPLKYFNKITTGITIIQHKLNAPYAVFAPRLYLNTIKSKQDPAQG
jgi:hypothetical protein